MRIFACLVVAHLTFAAAAAPATPQRINPAFFGIWKLNVPKSDFGSKPKPQSGQLNWTESGWVLAIVNADGSLHAEAVMTERGCALIGFPDIQWCKVKISSPGHSYFSLNEGCDPLRGTDIELLDKNTIQITHQTFSEDGSTYAGKEIWERQAMKQRNVS